MRPIKILFYTLAAFSTVLIAIGAWQFFGPAVHPELSGILTEEEIPNQKLILNAYFDKNIPGESCSHQFIARDDQFIYVDLKCGENHSFHKVEYDKKTYSMLSHSGTQVGSFYEKSLIRLYPEVIYKKLNLKNNLTP